MGAGEVLLLPLNTLKVQTQTNAEFRRKLMRPDGSG